MMVNSGLSGGLYYIYISGWWCNTHLEKYIKIVNVKDDIPDITENCFKGLKPPTSNWPIEIANG